MADGASVELILSYYNCRSAELLITFKRILKTELFDIAYKVNVPIVFAVTQGVLEKTHTKFYTHNGTVSHKIFAP